MNVTLELVSNEKLFFNVSKFGGYIGQTTSSTKEPQFNGEQNEYLNTMSGLMNYCAPLSSYRARIDNGHAQNQKQMCAYQDLL